MLLYQWMCSYAFLSINDDNIIQTLANEMNNADILNIHCCSFTFPRIQGKAKKFYFLHDVIIATADKGSHLDKALGCDFDAIIAPSEFAKAIYEKNREIIHGDILCYIIPRHINTKDKYLNENQLAKPEFLKT